MQTPSIACITYINLLLFFTSTVSLPVDAHSRRKRYKSALAKDRSQLLPNGPETKAMNWDITDHDRSQGEFNWNKQHHSSLSDESEDAGSVGSAFFDEIMNDRTFLEVLEFMSDHEEEVGPVGDYVGKTREPIIYNAEEIPDLPLEDEYYDYPDNIDYFHNDMPKIADTKDGMDYRLLDDEFWQKIDRNVGHISDYPENHDSKNDKWAHRNQLRSDIAKYLGNKLAKKLNVSRMQVPWSKMKADDILNWPSDVQFKPLYQVNTNEVEKLHKLVKEDQLDFTPEFLGRFQMITEWPNQANQLSSDIAKYLGNKLAKKLNRKKAKVPWSKMTAEDIINWPSDVEFKPLYKVNTNALKRVHTLFKEDLLDFSPEFLSRVKARDQISLH